MDRYKALTVLAVVADAGSMRRAARILGMTPSGVSQHIAQLEKDTRVTLLHRSSRRITLTEAGEALYAGGAAVLAAVQAAELRLAELRDTPAGELTIRVPPGIAERRLAEALGPVLESNPALTLRLIVTDDPVDLAEDRIDLAICIGGLTGSEGVVRHLTSWETIVCASPRYLARRDEPLAPEDLQVHELLIPARCRHGALEFRRIERPPARRPASPGAASQGPASPSVVSVPRDGLPEREASLVKLESRVTTHSTRSLTDLAIGGFGVMIAARPTVSEELADGRLTRILTAWQLPPTDVVLVMPLRAHQPAKVRFAVDALRERFAPTAVVEERRTMAPSAG
jgi:LysR family transcriptional regulator, transcriptional activator for aaeXAB operon